MNDPVRKEHAVGEVAYLKIVAVKDAGAFLDWGRPKDLLLPWSEVKQEQRRLVVEGRKILVVIFEADDGRPAASTRLDDFLYDTCEEFAEGDKVSILVTDHTELGLRVIVNDRYWGLVHANEVFRTVHRGHRQQAYVKALRPDHKLNISLTAPGFAKAETAAQGVLRVLKRNGGFLAVGDRTPPAEIYALFGISKKAFKLAIGTLYRSRQITLDEGGIRIAGGTA